MAFEKTINLTDTEMCVKIKGKNCDIRNDSNATLYVSRHANIVPDADEVLSVPPNQAVKYCGLLGEIYLLGKGKVQICGNNHSSPLFRCAATSSGEGGVAQSYVDMQDADTLNRAKDYAEGIISNPNLIDNWYFADPINQRGQTEYTQEHQYCIDRWVQRGGGTITLTDGGLHSNATYAFAGIMQAIENGKKNLAGKTVTFSALLHNVSGGIVTVGVTNGAGAGFAGTFIVENQTDNDGLISVTTTIPKNLENESLNVAVVAKEGSEAEFTVKAVKLELGEIQTLARQDAEGNWVIIDSPTNSAVELAKCQREYKEITGMYAPYAVYTNSIAFAIPHVADMRVTPTATFKNTNFSETGASIRKTSDGSAVEGFTGNLLIGTGTDCVVVNMTKTSHGLNWQEVYLLIKDANPVCLDATL